MAGLTRLLRYQWLSYWRKTLRGGTAAKSNLVVLGLISLAGFARYATILRNATAETAQGRIALLELLLAAVMTACLLPIWDDGQLSMGSRDLTRFPLGAWTRFGVRALSRFVTPANWVLAAFCLAALWPVLALPHPVAAVPAYLLLLGAAWAAGLGLAHFRATAAGSRVLNICWLLIAIAAVLAWRLGVRELPPLPSRLVIAAGQGNFAAIAALALCTVACAMAAVRSLPWMLDRAPAERTRAGKSARRMSLFRRELRVLARLTEIRMGWAVAAAFCFYLATAGQPEPDALRVMLGVFSLVTIALGMNNFGLDYTTGLDRFLLWPVRGTQVLLAKNLAFAAVSASAWAPMVLLALWRFGWHEASADFLEAAALLFAVLAWGNIASVRHPASGMGSKSVIIDQVIGMAAAALPAAFAIGALRRFGWNAPLYILLFAAVCA
ncbi:MAG: hypothetical protein M3Z09_11430, partial [Acidobacteriota bacterium]|nr:hypothetical protein [Acidobacteriota bacterium]